MEGMAESGITYSSKLDLHGFFQDQPCSFFLIDHDIFFRFDHAFFSGSNMEIFRIDYVFFSISIMNFGSTIEIKI